MEKVSYIREADFVDEAEVMEGGFGSYGNDQKKDKKEKDEFSYEIVEYIGVIRALSNGFSKELNIVSWNGRRPKFDIRDWNSDHSRMTRGVTLTKDDMDKICELVEREGRAAFDAVWDKLVGASQQPA